MYINDMNTCVKCTHVMYKIWRRRVAIVYLADTKSKYERQKEMAMS